MCLTMRHVSSADWPGNKLILMIRCDTMRHDDMYGQPVAHGRDDKDPELL